MGANCSVNPWVFSYTISSLEVNQLTTESSELVITPLAKSHPLLSGASIVIHWVYLAIAYAYLCASNRASNGVECLIGYSRAHINSNNSWKNFNYRIVESRLSRPQSITDMSSECNRVTALWLDVSVMMLSVSSKVFCRLDFSNKEHATNKEHQINKDENKITWVRPLQQTERRPNEGGEAMVTIKKSLIIKEEQRRLPLGCWPPSMINERSSQKAVGQQANLLPPKTKANKSQKYKLALFRATPADHQPEHWRKSPRIKTMKYHNYANQKMSAGNA